MIFPIYKGIEFPLIILEPLCLTDFFLKLASVYILLRKFYLIIYYNNHYHRRNSINELYEELYLSLYTKLLYESLFVLLLCVKNST